jgi:hypothetical protein
LTFAASLTQKTSIEYLSATPTPSPILPILHNPHKRNGSSPSEAVAARFPDLCVDISYLADNESILAKVCLNFLTPVGHGEDTFAGIEKRGVEEGLQVGEIPCTSNESTFSTTG